jgi:hypothetical protein
LGKSGGGGARLKGGGKSGLDRVGGRVAAAEQYRAHPPVHSSATEGLQSAGKAARSMSDTAVLLAVLAFLLL